MIGILTMIAIAVIIGSIALAKRGRGKRRAMGRYIRGSVAESMVLGTLAAKTAVGQVFGDTVTERTLISSIVARYSMTAFTKSTGDGPILVGVAHSDYAVSEIEAWIETTGSWKEADLVQREVGARKIRMIGIFENPIDEAATSVLNDGKMIKTKLNWILTQGQSLDLWAYNQGTSALATTSPLVQAFGHVNLFPK